MKLEELIRQCGRNVDLGTATVELIMPYLKKLGKEGGGISFLLKFEQTPLRKGGYMGKLFAKVEEHDQVRCVIPLCLEPHGWYETNGEGVFFPDLPDDGSLDVLELLKKKVKMGDKLTVLYVFAPDI